MMATTKAAHVRWMIRKDLPAVMEIEQASFDNPWSQAMFADHMCKRHTIGMIAERDDKIAGFMVYELHKNQLILINFAVHPGCRHAGVGAAMVDKLKAKLQPDARNRIALMVSEPNLDGQLFFRALGFRATRIIKGPYDDSDHDAYYMEYREEWAGQTVT